jgi:hypothetical protein
MPVQKSPVAFEPALARGIVTHPQLTITTDRAQNKATFVVECELEFTQFESMP